MRQLTISEAGIKMRQLSVVESLQINGGANNHPADKEKAAFVEGGITGSLLGVFAGVPLTHLSLYAISPKSGATFAATLVGTVVASAAVLGTVFAYGNNAIYNYVHS